MHLVEINYPISENKMKKKKKEKKTVNVCVLTDGSSRGLRRLSEILAPLGSGGPLLATRWPLALDSPLGEVFMMANLAKRFFSLPSNISFHLKPQGRALAFTLEPGG